jgi:Fe-S-cluster containining protein
VQRCPWLRKVPGQNRYVCRIHDLKPDHCRRYPRSRRHVERTGCPGFDRSGTRDA